ncbi:MAG: FeoB-associated Cys-rich membrane protein [Akkermansia sp.]|nr:FeoB-associated Cys-rich membrane protein [Akkermansia sp.]
MNDLIIILILLIAAAAALYSCIRRMTKGGCGCGECGGNCKSCPKKQNKP